MGDQRLDVHAPRPHQLEAQRVLWQGRGAGGMSGACLAGSQASHLQWRSDVKDTPRPLRTVLQYRKLPTISFSSTTASTSGRVISSCPMPTSTQRPPGPSALSATCGAGDGGAWEASYLQNAADSASLHSVELRALAAPATCIVCWKPAASTTMSKPSGAPAACRRAAAASAGDSSVDVCSVASAPSCRQQVEQEWAGWQRPSIRIEARQPPTVAHALTTCLLGQLQVPFLQISDGHAVGAKRLGCQQADQACDRAGHRRRRRRKAEIGLEGRLRQPAQLECEQPAAAAAATACACR